MKNTVLLLLFVLFMAKNATSQQTTQYSHYAYNHFGINPAVAGSKECIDLRFGYRTQWLGFAGAPKTALFNGHGRFQLRKSKNPRIYHGVGLMVENDVMGPFSRTMLNLAYAYHIPVTSKHMLSFGLFGGLEQFRFNGTALTYLNSDDPAINESQSTKLMVPEFSPGLFLYSEDLFVGFTIKQLLMNKIKNAGTKSRLSHHYLITAGKIFGGDNGISIIPTGLLKITTWAVPALDVNLFLDFKNVLMLGLGWRNTDAVVALAKINFLKHFTLAYSFDMTTSRIRLGSSNTHEVQLGIYACPLSGRTAYDCPIW
jgi:type IX secretion system PorP/SprF family membrane protein